MMAYGEFYVEHQGWARWPKTLIMCRKRGYEIIERRRYVPERTCEVVNVNGYAFRFECSLCGYVAIVHNCDIRLDELPNYCPNCGAKVTKSDQDL